MSLISNKDNNGINKYSNNNGFINPLLVNIILDPSDPDLDEEDSFDSMIENSDANLAFADVVEHTNNPDMLHDWDITSTVNNENNSYSSNFEGRLLYVLSDHQLHGCMAVKTKNFADMDLYNKIKIFDDHNRQLS